MHMVYNYTTKHNNNMRLFFVSVLLLLTLCLADASQNLRIGDRGLLRLRRPDFGNATLASNASAPAQKRPRRSDSVVLHNDDIVRFL